METQPCSPLLAERDASDLDARDTLLRENLSLVHHVARKLARRLADDADMDELVSAGTLGLMNAAESFDPGRGLAFSTYAVPRIRGAILDELRRQDHVPRSVRRKTRSIAQAHESLMHLLGRHPSSREVASELGVSCETLYRWTSDVETAVHLPLDGHGRATSDERPTPPSCWAVVTSCPTSASRVKTTLRSSATRCSSLATRSAPCSRSTTSRTSARVRSATCSA